MSRSFIVELDESAEDIPRAARRVIFNADFLKVAKLCTGDIIALSGGDNTISRKVSPTELLQVAGSPRCRISCLTACLIGIRCGGCVAFY